MIYKLDEWHFRNAVSNAAACLDMLSDHPELEDPMLYDLSLDDSMLVILELDDSEIKWRPAYVSSNLCLTVVEYLIEYVYYAFASLARHQAGKVDPRSLARILHEVYGFGIEEPTANAAYVDITYIGEYFSPSTLFAIRMFERDGLYGQLVEEARFFAEKNGEAVLEYVSGENGCFDENLQYVGDCKFFGTRKSVGWVVRGANWSEANDKPTAVPAPGYEVDGWYLEDGTRLEDDTKITGDHRVMVRFRKTSELVSA